MHQLACPMWMQIASRIATESCYTNGFRVSSTPCDQAHLSHKSLSQTWNGRSGIPSSFSSNIPYPDIFQEWTNWLSFPMVFRYGFPMVFLWFSNSEIFPDSQSRPKKNASCIETASPSSRPRLPKLVMDRTTGLGFELKIRYPKTNECWKLKTWSFLYICINIYICMYV